MILFMVTVMASPQRLLMNKYQIFLQAILDAFATLCGYAYDLMDSEDARGHWYFEIEPHKFWDFGCNRSSPSERQFWGFGKHLLLSRLGSQGTGNHHI